MSFVAKRMAVPDASSSPAGFLSQTCSVLSASPGLLDYLTANTFPDGTVRELSNLLVFVEDGVIKVCLNDRANGCSLWRSGTDILDVLASVDAAIQKGTADWRAARKPVVKPRKG